MAKQTTPFSSIYSIEKKKFEYETVDQSVKLANTSKRDPVYFFFE
ncbi:hypothetical protein RU93_GL001150 [Enterococcus aquimarinus]|uniref:Uncharacterized protein n=1 Tax=Enterococcus aquimarinus TaxID=328396 RepID=A0A1L8QWM7_9ENTE|nr:hypothetical protein RU93_GL001150 [Enterococcus aquimarinus]